MATMQEIKTRIAQECELLAGCFPYEEDRVRGDSWDAIAFEAADLARLMAYSATRVAGYAGYARREANEE